MNTDYSYNNKLNSQNAILEPKVIRLNIVFFNFALILIPSYKAVKIRQRPTIRE